MSFHLLLPLLCSQFLFIIQGALGGPLGTRDDAIRFFKHVLRERQTPRLKGETFASRTYFYVGGRYKDTPAGRVMSGQMYVEKLVPKQSASPKRKRVPLVFMTGGSQTGTNWLNTPDNRPGWTSYFLSQGYTVYITDQPQRGRSPWVPGDGGMSITNATFVQNLFTTSERNGGLWPQAGLHTQWPGTGLPGDSIFDAFYAGEIQQQTNATYQAANNILAFTSLLNRIGPAILISHSMAGPYGWGVADQRPSHVKGIIALEPEGPPFENKIIGAGSPRQYGLTTLPLTYDPLVTVLPNGTTDLFIGTVRMSSPEPGKLSDCLLQSEPARKLVNLEGIPVLLYVTQASYHAFYDYCTYMYMVQAGVSVDFLDLAEVGVLGNGHFSFMEKNNLRIAGLLDAWLEKVVL